MNLRGFMTKQQLKRWKKLSTGLAKTYNLTPERKAKLIAEVENAIEILCWDFPLEDIQDWDGNAGKAYVCDEMDEYLWSNKFYLERRSGRVIYGHFGEMISACVRAGFDVAVKPSAGVLGFTVGDLRAIFGRKLPKWVSQWFEEPLTAEVPDSMGVWL
jgi:hypothetical protein